MTYAIPAANIGAMRSRIAELSGRAARLGVEPIVMTELARYCTGIEEGARRAEIVEIDVTGIAIRLPGWTFVGTIEHMGAENILRAAPGQTIPETYRTGAAACDHCGTDRNRHDTFVVLSDAGEYRQVGRTCTRDYLGHIDPAQLAAMMERVAHLLDEPGDSDEGWGRGYAPAYTPREAAATAAAIVRTYGFRRSAEPMSTATRMAAWISGVGNLAREMRSEGFAVEAGDFDAADRAIEWVQTAPSNDYIANLRVAATAAYVSTRHFGLLASLPGAYARDLEGAAVRAAREAQWAAERAAREARAITAPEGKVTVEGTILSIRETATDFGMALKMTVEDSRGFRVYGTCPAAVAGDAAAGARIRFTATLTRSDRDATFAFASRPSRAALVAA